MSPQTGKDVYLLRLRRRVVVIHSLYDVLLFEFYAILLWVEVFLDVMLKNRVNIFCLLLTLLQQSPSPAGPLPLDSLGETSFLFEGLGEGFPPPPEGGRGELFTF